MGRIYNYEISCGCLVSPDGGGGLIPCFSNDCKYEEWTKTEEYIRFQKELNENNGEPGETNISSCLATTLSLMGSDFHQTSEFTKNPRFKEMNPLARPFVSGPSEWGENGLNLVMAGFVLYLDQSDQVGAKVLLSAILMLANAYWSKLWKASVWLEGAGLGLFY